MYRRSTSPAWAASFNRLKPNMAFMFMFEAVTFKLCVQDIKKKKKKLFDWHGFIFLHSFTKQWCGRSWKEKNNCCVSLGVNLFTHLLSFIKKAQRNFYWATILMHFIICISISFFLRKSVFALLCLSLTIGTLMWSWKEIGMRVELMCLNKVWWSHIK